MFSLSFGQAASFLTNFIAIVFAIRILGVENYGMFSSILAVVSILSKLVDFGIEPIIFRELSKDNKSFHLFNSSLNLRFLFFVLLVIGYNLVAPFLNLTKNEILLSNILFFTIVFSAKTFVVRELLSTPFKTNLKMHYPMILSLVDNLLLLALIVAIKFIKEPLIYFTIAYTVSNLPGFILSFYFLKKKFNYVYEFTFYNSKWLLKESLPMLGFVILTNIFLQIDIIILNSMKGSYEVGIYSAGVRLTMPLSIIPNAIVMTIFPKLVQKLKDNESTEYLTNFVIKILLFISFSMAAVFSFESKEIVNLLFGKQYIASSLSASILYWCQVFIFFSTYSLSFLIASNNQKYNFIYSLIQVVVNVFLCIFLIPDYSYFGAAIAKLAASFLSFIFVLIALNKLNFQLSIGKPKLVLWLVLLSAILYIISSLPIYFYLVISVIVILLITLVTKYFEEKELLIFFKLFKKEELGLKFIELLNKKISF
ncbi:flippase [Stygiobacter electus]|uniref:Flippase n=1 Tax=Stygiobacter electus TaxID=3032292 RepID=A0AAE3TBX5_9BACT|nr:flippase [Stygiobacter electus]MDF1610891.1 flippase [Stygiobacter electus]